MKKILISLFVVSALTINVKAQDILEPEFVGETILVNPNNTSTPLEKHLTQNRTVASTGLILSGIGKMRSQLQIDGCCANVKVNKNDEVKLIVRNIDNLTETLFQS